MLNSVSREFINRLRDSAARTSALGRLSDWLVSNTTLKGRPYSFEGHTFQKALLDERHPDVCVIKPSQVGLSETVARLTLGFLSVQSGTTAIYTLPTVNEALKFVKARVDPVIEGSKYIKSIMSSGNDSSSFKRIGGSNFYAVGTWGRDLISIDADLVCCDEVDSSNPVVLKSVESRLIHSQFKNEELGIRGFRRYLSTPSVTGVGVSMMFQRSDQRRRLVRCKHCTHWFHPNFLEHFVVQGYDLSFSGLTAEDVMDLDDRGLLSTTKLLCPSCHNEITLSNLGDEYREWVAEFPDVKAFRGYMVSPLDIPDYHTPESILRSRIRYGNEESQFYNYALGLPYDSSSNSIIAEAVRNNTTLAPVFPGTRISGAVLGLDVGKTSWITVAIPVRINGISELHILWAEQVRVEDDNLFTTVVERIKQFGVVRAVVDSAPYFDTIMRIQAAFPDGMVLPCSYTLTDRKLPSYIVNENTWTVSANRTKCFDVLAKRINTGRVKFATFPEIKTFSNHLQNIKRIERREDGELVSESWVKVGNVGDHYAHSALYASLAAQMIEAGEYTNFSPSVSIRQAVVGRVHEKTY